MKIIFSIDKFLRKSKIQIANTNYKLHNTNGNNKSATNQNIDQYVQIQIDNVPKVLKNL